MPAYNAEKTLKDVVERTPKVYDEMLVVNDGSTDKTKEVAESLGLKVVSHPKNRGYGGAQKTGFKKAMEDGADIILLLHSDGQYAPEKAPSMIEPIKNGEADVVLGSRVLGKKYAGGRNAFFEICR